MTAFANTIDLRLAVSDLVGNRTISDVFPRLIELAEVDLNSRLRTRHQIDDHTLTFVSGAATLPTDFLEILSACLRSGQKRDFQITGSEMLIPGFAGDLDIQYYAKIPTLTTSPLATNWLLERYPNAYLYGVGLQAAKHLRNAELAVQIAGLYGEALGLIRVDDERARYSASTVQVRGPTP